MRQVNIAEAKSTLSELVVRALEGEDIVIARDNNPLVRLVPIATIGVKQRKPGSARGRVTLAPDYAEPLEDFAPYR